MVLYDDSETENGVMKYNFDCALLMNDVVALIHLNVSHVILVE